MHPTSTRSFGSSFPSRTLDGGRPYLTELQDTIHELVCVPDSAFGQASRDSDIVLQGVETLCIDGGFYNTIGSLTAGICARHFGVPLYAATAMIKVAPCDHRGQMASAEKRDFAGVYGVVPGVEFSYVENEHVPADLVTGYITEYGVISPSAVAEAAAALFQPTPPA